MVNLIFEVNLETIDFENESYNTQVTNIKRYEFSSDKIDGNLLDELHVKIIRTKGDWLSYNINYFNSNYYVTANLIFHTPNINKEHNEVIDKVLKECEKFFRENNFKPIQSNYNNLEKLVEMFNNDGFVISIEDEGGGGILHNEQIEKALRDNNIEFEPISIRQSRFDGGASGGSEKFIYFILTTVQSGITYDVLKFLITSKLGIPADYFKISVLDNFKFKRLRKIIADRVREDERDLILNELYKGEEDITVVFKTRNSKITLICDRNYELKEMKADENIT